jgi:hypothetical protein
MSQLELYDQRIARIMSKIEALHDRKFSFSCGKWPPVWEPPMTEEDVTAFEEEKGIRLPEDYRRFLTTIAASGNQPFYGLLPLRQEESTVEQPFPYTLDHILYFLHMTEEEMDEFYDDDTPFTADNGLIALCTEGDGMDSVLVVNSKDPDTYGTVWYYDLANDCGIIPMRNKDTGKPFHFLDWLEYWADRTAGLKSQEYFGFSETIQLPKAPDNPDIMGRKMGWIE